MSQKQRISWIDGIRFIAFVIVFTRHHFESFFPDLLPEMLGGPALFLFRGLTGKNAVAMFAVLSGYFAAESASKYSFSKYVIQRYLYFMSRLFAANFMAVIFIILFSITQPSAGSIFTWPQLDISLLWQWFWSDSFFFSCYLIPTYWCIAEFFSGDIITFLIISFSPKDNEKSCFLSSLYFIFSWHQPVGESGSQTVLQAQSSGALTGFHLRF